MIEALEKYMIPDHMWGQILKYNKQYIDHLDIRAHLTNDELSLIANGAVDVGRELLAEDEFDYVTWAKVALRAIHPKQVLNGPKRNTFQNRRSINTSHH